MMRSSSSGGTQYLDMPVLECGIPLVSTFGPVNDICRALELELRNHI
jgi:hypothetical protein